jgi:hypothetical protein
MDNQDLVASVTEVMRYLEMPIAQFKVEWMKLGVMDKMQLRTGIGNGTYTY